MAKTVVIIGAGVVGVSTALRLQSELAPDGGQVVLLDRDGVAAEASAGNAGAFAFTDLEPLATPGIMKKAPAWLLDPLGPLSVPPAYALQLTPWLIRFWRASWQDRYHSVVKAQASLMHLAQAATERQIADTLGESMMQRDGALQLYESEAEFAASQRGWQLRQDHGIRFSFMHSPAEIAEIQPGLSPRFTHAGYTPDWMNTCDPKAWVEHLFTAFLARGGQLRRADVRDLESGDAGVTIVTTGNRIMADQVVVAAGAWSHQLAHRLGEKLPLETERGYNTTLPAGCFDLRTHVTFCRHGFVVSRIRGGVRVGGAVELGGLKLAPNFKRANTLLSKAARFMPELDTAEGTQWMGFRPSLPDSLPVIGPAARDKRVIYAFGHGHVGLTQSAATAELVTDILQSRATAIDTSPFGADRF
ncbi:NAD(P)/FAD-dependent oxidoreductase [Phaeobacter porticola]|uniref:D-amino acid dehydrogenase small subunit n=1 Tax=Phaeobacter porticola TaxID=1844006 RepID=A0A1L3I7Y1_9RHOB|nr:FAD-dependent oxidoreductase [Phaeobacter porticola]APG48220.1 D-amino acid dehydrogenase small subunit [Phaeobacter porticola]